MRIKVGATQINLYDSISDLPVIRYQKFQEYSLIDTGIGKDIADIDVHFSKLDGYLVANDIESAVQERKNLHKNFFYLFLGVDTNTYSFCCLIKDIDGKALPLDEEEFDKVVKLLEKGKMPYEQLDEAVLELKKKYIQK